MVFVAELASPVGAKCALQADGGIGNPLLLCTTHHVGQASQFPGLGPVVVALREDVAQVDAGTRTPPRWAQWRSKCTRALTSPLVEEGSRIAHAGLRVEAVDHRLHLSHLRRPFGARERANGDLF